jgi:hypothetical protein
VRPHVRLGHDFTPYERVRLGQREAHEAGAYVARTSDAVAGWYNPAGLALSRGSGLNASATAEEWVRFRFGSAVNEVARSRLQSIGSFVAAVLGAPVIKSDRCMYKRIAARSARVRIDPPAFMAECCTGPLRRQALRGLAPVHGGDRRLWYTR